MTRRATFVAILLVQAVAFAQGTRPQTPEAITVLRPARVFDGEAMHEGWAVRVQGERIQAVGPAANVAASGATVASTRSH